MTRGDEIVEHGAERLETLAEKADARGGVGAKVADELAEDAAFLRKLKPSLVAKRVRGETPAPAAPAGPQLASRPNAKKRGGGGPNPLVVAVAAFALGIAIAKLIDWRGHAHPRR
jgi:hypothetical protein